MTLASVLASAALLLSSPDAPSQTYILDSEAWQDARQVSVVGKAADVEVVVSEVARAELVYPKDAEVLEPQLAQTEDGLELTLSDEASEHRVNVMLYLPADTELQLRLGQGGVRVEGVATLDINVDIGSVQVLGSESATIRTTAGDVRLENATGAAQISSTSGNLSLDFIQAPSASVSAQTGAGDVELSLPPDADVSVTGTSASRELSGFDELLRPDEGRTRLGQGWHEVSLSSEVGSVTFKLKGN